MLSNSFVGARKREATRYGFDRMAEFIAYSHEVGLQKPDPRIYRLTCERLALQPSEVVFVDDRQENVDAAQAFGMIGLLAGADDAGVVIAAIASALSED